MTRDEWYESNNFRLLRLLNHYAADFGQKLQEMWDIMELVAALRPDCCCHDKTTILQKEMRMMPKIYGRQQGNGKSYLLRTWNR